ncbi:MAG TPA: sodium:solute symporter family protein [Vicinamibacterales bacterium]|jgi:SSS family solute:Na+ symporter|nr:sodium:solute symporter family protein [Vicinamibacterales bacterium]
MLLTRIDWLVIAAYFVLNIGIGFYYASRARTSTNEFFLSGQNVPWWLAGTSMVATTFAADTPLVVTGLVARYGIAGNWLWWNMAASGMLTSFVYARLWRRAGVMTDVEFAELRYAGKPAAFLRGFRAVYLGIPMNCIIIGWVNLAMLKILQVTLGLDSRGALWALFAMLAFTAFYTTIAGLWGVLVTDLVQFVLKMGMVVALAFFSVRAVGGLNALEVKVRALDAGATDSRLAFFPSLSSPWMPAITLFVYLGVSWWASWYPGAEPGGGGYIAQRIFSSKDERHGLFATLWFNIAHYAVRPWPWILTALCSIVLYPTLADKESGYVRTLMDPAVFPPALRGVMLAAFAAAYMSTIGTQLNWGASYVVNDCYRRFLRRGGSEREYVTVSQITTVALMLMSIYVTLHLASIEQAWKLLIVTGAGTGTVLLLRWLWWRINAWSEVSAMAIAAAVSLYLQLVLKWDSDKPRDFAFIMLVTVGLTTLGWLAVTWLTKPEPLATLDTFYARVRPPGWWGPVPTSVLNRQDLALNPGELATTSLGRGLVNAFLGCVLIYASLFGVGEILLGSVALGIGLLGVAALAAAAIARNDAYRAHADSRASHALTGAAGFSTRAS